jgi:hypothetical protein
LALHSPALQNAPAKPDGHTWSLQHASAEAQQSSFLVHADAHAPALHVT